MTLSRLSVFLTLITLPICAHPGSPRAQDAQNPPLPQSAAAIPTGSMIVYVSDFDLDVAPRKSFQKPAPRTSLPSAAGTSSSSPSVDRKNTPSRSASATSQASASSDTSGEETPADRANALVSAVSENLVRALTQAGYDARRLPAGAPLPKLGVRIRGVFAEADEQNRARRLLVGGDPLGPNILLFVGVNNLKSPEQPLYELADPRVNDPRHGPVITVTSYAPASRFELSRDPSGDELKKIASKIAADFTTLVNVNRLSLAQ